MRLSQPRSWEEGPVDLGLRPLIQGHPWCGLVLVKHTWADSGSAAGSWRQNHLPKLGAGAGEAG